MADQQVQVVDLKFVQDALEIEMGVDKEQSKPDARLVDDLGLDSLDVVELAMFFESALNIEIADDDMEKMQTVQQVVDYLQWATKAVDTA